MRILRLEIGTKNLEEQLAFYKDVLNMQVDKTEDNSFEILIGYSVLRFVRDENAAAYHIALHIPDRQEEKAMEWLKSRVPLLKNDEEEIIDFKGWDAKSVYFYDKDKNIMEFISRRDLNPSPALDFSGHSIIGIAEIGMATSNVREKYDFLHEHCSLEVFDGDFGQFCAIGDHRGLFITIDKHSKNWFPTGDTAHSSDFRISFSHKEQRYDITFIKDRLISSK